MDKMEGRRGLPASLQKGEVRKARTRCHEAYVDDILR